MRLSQDLRLVNLDSAFMDFHAEKETTEHRLEKIKGAITAKVIASQKHYSAERSSGKLRVLQQQMARLSLRDEHYQINCRAVAGDPRIRQLLPLGTVP
jgi:hypothetical protein